jgi:glycine cleavage system aminomethyltransferase T/glycine/D-amino acid oxidase-like deaminating enzyme
VVVGGGISGLSTAYHLACEGWTDVVLLERDQLTSGTTWHAAGLLVSGGMGDETMLEMFQRSHQLYSHELEAETGQSCGYAEVGYLQAVAGRHRAEGLRRDSRFQQRLGIDTHEVSPAEVSTYWPQAHTDDVEAGFFFPRQGRVNPVDTAMAFAKGARARGVRIVEGVEVTGVTVRDGAVAGVVTAQGTIEAEHVVNCAGLWARTFGLMAGVHVPLQAAEHYYMITEPIADLPRDTPVLEDGSRYAYFREEVGSMLIGLFEPVARAWHHERSPKGPYLTLEPHWDRILPYLDVALGRLTIGHDVGIKTFFCGPESFTPDVHMLLGEAPELRNYWVLAGMNSLGILLGGGAGQVLAQWMVSGRPQTDVTGIDIARFGPWANEPGFLEQRVVEQLGRLFGDSMFPHRRQSTGRDLRHSPVHERLVQHGAQFITAAEWEFAEWFDVDASGLVSDDSFDAQPWRAYAAAEHEAVRNAVGLFDMTIMSRLEVTGCDALALLDRLSASVVDVAPGRVVYTVWLDETGRIVVDLTVMRLGPQRFLVVCGPEHHTRVLAWMQRHLPAGADVVIDDLTDATVLLSLQGPRSRELLAALTIADLSAAAQPHLTVRDLEVAGVPLLLARVTYVGELGFELYAPANRAEELFDALVEAGRDLGLRLAGAAAMESLRTEKGNLEYAVDLDNSDTPMQVGLGFLVAWDKPGGFVGHDALAAVNALGPPSTRLVRFLALDPSVELFGHEVVCRDGREVGHLRYGTFGHTLGASCGQGMVHRVDGPVTTEWLTAGEFTLHVNGAVVPAVASLRGFHDPDGLRYRHA